MKPDLSSFNFAEGAQILINKPLRWTSFDAVGFLRKATKVKKIGHSGTLDPLATGLLILCTGKFTKKLTALTGLDKEYTGTFTIGATTASYDLESEPENFKDFSQITDDEIIKASEKFIGTIEQIPPMFSAIKQDGQTLYDLARKGIEVEIKKRIVTIISFEITKINLPEIDFKIHCASGTYIRSIARDFGNELGCGAYLSELTRTKVGEFCLENAYDVDEIAQFASIEVTTKGVKKRW